MSNIVDNNGRDRFIPYITIDEHGDTWYHSCIDNAEIGDQHVYLTFDEAYAKAEYYDKIWSHKDHKSEG